MNLISFRGIAFRPVAFLGFKNFMVKQTSSTVGLGKSNGATFLKLSLIYFILG